MFVQFYWFTYVAFATFLASELIYITFVFFWSFVFYVATLVNMLSFVVVVLVTIRTFEMVRLVSFGFFVSHARDVLLYAQRKASRTKVLE